MRHLQRLAGPAIVALALAVLLQPAGLGRALGKEAMMATLDVPIALDSPPGTELLVGLTVTVLTEDGEHPVEGSPIVLILTGGEGDTTEAWGVQDKIGHYLARATVPESGVRGLRVVLRGSTDIDLYLLADPFTFGGISARTAQVAPPPTPGLTPFPRATVGAVAPIASTAAVAAPADPAAAAAPANPMTAAAPADPTAAAAPASDGVAWWPAALLAIALGVAVVIAVRVRVARRSAQGT